MEKIKLVLDWFPNNIHVGFLLSQVRGFYREAGIELQIEGDVHGVMETSGMDFLCGPQASMLENMAAGADILGIGQITQVQDSGLISLKEAGIKRPRDLEGKRITHWTPKWFHLLIDELVRKDGGNPDLITKVPMDVEHPQEVLGQTADAIWIYKNWEYYVMEQANKDCNFVEIADYGHPFDYPTPAIAVNGELWRSKPDLVKRFMAVTEKGYQCVVAEGLKVIPEIRHLLPDVEDNILYKGVEHLLPRFLNKDGQWGNLNIEAWQSLLDLFLESGIYGRTYPERTYLASFRD